MAHAQLKMIGKVEQVYAEALLDLAGDAYSEVAQQMQQIGELIKSQPDLVRLISTRTINVDERSKIIERLFKGKVSDVLYRFLQVVNRKNRLGVLEGIVRAFGAAVDRKLGVLEVDGYVAKLDDGAADRITLGLSQALGKNVVLTLHEDASLIGGPKIRIGMRP